MEQKSLHYFKNAQEWRNWLKQNHATSKGVDLVFYLVGSEFESMRWEEAVKVAICHGWIDSTVRKIDDERRKQTFTPRKAKSVRSKLNKTYIEQLTQQNLMHLSGLSVIDAAKENGSWTALDAVEELLIPEDLKIAFEVNKAAFEHYMKFSPSYRKSYLYWLNHAKREETRKIRIEEIIRLCEKNIKTRP